MVVPNVQQRMQHGARLSLLEILLARPRQMTAGRSQSSRCIGLIARVGCGMPDLCHSRAGRKNDKETKQRCYRSAHLLAFSMVLRMYARDSIGRAGIAGEAASESTMLTRSDRTDTGSALRSEERLPQSDSSAALWESQIPVRLLRCSSGASN
jgi:hypothetical protein